MVFVRKLLGLPPGSTERHALSMKVRSLREEILALYKSGQIADALLKTESALPLLKRERAWLALAKATSECGRFAEELGRHRPAILHYRRSAALFRQLNEVASEGEVRAELGSIFLTIKESSEAIVELKAARKLLESAAEQNKLLVALADLSEAYFLEEKIEEAQKIATDLMSLAQKATDREAIANAHRILGVLEGRLGHDDLSVDNLRQAETLYEQLNLTEMQISVLHHLELAFRNKKAYDQAFELLNKALRLNESLKNDKQQCSLLTSLAALEIDTLAYEKAGITLQSALSLARTKGLRYPEEATALYWIGYWRSAQRHWKETEEYASRAAEIFAEFDDFTQATLSQELAGMAIGELFGSKLHGREKPVSKNKPGRQGAHVWTGERFRFLSFVMNLVFALILGWCTLFYLCICFPNSKGLQRLTSIVFLMVPLLSLTLMYFYTDLLFKEYAEDQLRQKTWVLRRWLKDSMTWLLAIGMISSVCYVALRLLAPVFFWPKAFLSWDAHRVESLIGIEPSPLVRLQLQSWLRGLSYALVSGLYGFNFVFLWFGVASFASVSAGADAEVIVKEKLKPALYGRFAVILRGSLVLAVLLSVGGAILTILREVGTWWGLKVPELNLDLILDLLQTASKWFGIPLPSWIFLLHLPVAATMIRVMVPRLYYTKQMAALSWTSLFSYLGSAILAVPLFFRDEISGLPIGHFYDGYLGLVEGVYAAIYISFFIPLFGILALKKP